MREAGSEVSGAAPPSSGESQALTVTAGPGCCPHRPQHGGGQEVRGGFPGCLDFRPIPPCLVSPLGRWAH